MTEQSPIIRHIATTFDGTLVAVAEFERYVQIWDVERHGRIAAFKTTLDFGGRRLAVSRDGQCCVVGAYHVHGIALYDPVSGAEIWRRKDLKKVQRIRISNDSQRVYCGMEGKSFETLNIKNGRSKPSLRGVQDVWESEYDPVLFFERKNRDYKLTTAETKLIAALPRKTFATLAVAFAPQKVCISESGGTVRCFDIRGGALLWEFDPGNGSHALEVAYNEFTKEFVAVTWPFSKGGQHKLIGLDSEDGALRAIGHLSNCVESAFCLRGSRLLTSSGLLLDTDTAEVKTKFAFFPNIGGTEL